MPLLIKPPGERRHRVVETPVSTVDVFPTIAEVLGVSVAGAEGFAGRSLLRQPLEERPVLSETRRGRELQAVVFGRWKLLLGTESGERRLFDLELDPGELSDLAGAWPEVVAELERHREPWARANQAHLETRHVETPEFTPDETERLRGLGYIE